MVGLTIFNYTIFKITSFVMKNQKIVQKLTDYKIIKLIVNEENMNFEAISVYIRNLDKFILIYFREIKLFHNSRFRLTMTNIFS